MVRSGISPRFAYQSLSRLRCWQPCSRAMIVREALPFLATAAWPAAYNLVAGVMKDAAKSPQTVSA